MSNYDVTPEIKKKWIPILENFINTLKNWGPEQENDPNALTELELTGTDLNPARLKKILIEDFGYDEDVDMETNGWQMDFWIELYKEEYPTLVISGTGYTFEMHLYEKEDEEYE